MDKQRLEQALIAADAAGDVDAARELAAAIRGLKPPLAQTNPGEYDPGSKEYQSKYGPTGGTLDNLLAGAGKFQTDMARGARQFSTELGNLAGLDLLSPDNFGDEEVARQRQAQDAAKERDAPLMSTKAGIAGNIAGGVATAAPLALVPGANTYAGAGLTGAMLGATAPVGTEDDRGLNTALGFGGGAGGKLVGDKIAQVASRALARVRGPQAAANVAIGPSAAASQATAQGSLNLSARGGGAGFGSVGDDASAGLNEAQRRAMTAGQDLGMRLTPGQATGSRALQQLEAKLESQPMTSGPFNTIKEGNQRVLNRATARAIGEDASTVDSTVLARANDRIGAVFADVRDDTARSIDAQGFVNRMQSINDEFEGLLPGGKTVAQNPLVQRLFRYAEDGNATGRQLGDLTSKLGKAAHKEMSSPSGDRQLGAALYQIKDYTDDLVEEGLSPERLSDYQAARTQYRNLINITRNLGTVNPSSGNVSGASLANTLQKADKSGFLFGRNGSPMYDAARFAQAFKPIVGDSGTATRSMITNPLELAMSAPFNLAARAYTSSPSVRAAIAAQAATQGTGEAIAPFLEGTAPYLPALGGLLGANAAR